MRIALIGYGRMGREVEAVAIERGHKIVSMVDPLMDESAGAIRKSREVTESSLKGADIAIEFAQAEATVANVRRYAELQVSAVVGTTGWLDRENEVRQMVTDSGIGLISGSNFSIGAHVFFALAEHAARLVAGIDDYDLFLHEIHHRKKKDSPSGTALSLAGKIVNAVPRKKRIETARLDRAPDPDELHVSSSRGGSVPGIHTLYLDSAADTIEVRHSARSRGGFALGAVIAAEWLERRRGYFVVDDFIHDILMQE